MSMMTSQILKSADFTKTQKSRSQEKFFIITHQGLLYGKK